MKMVKNENTKTSAWPSLPTGPDTKCLLNDRVLLINKSVCRSITFGKCRDKEESKEFLRMEFDQLRLKERNRWNFDFYDEKPYMASEDDEDEDEEDDEFDKVKEEEQENQDQNNQQLRKRRIKYQWSKCDRLRA